MNDFMNTIFGPMHQDYCLYFYYLSLFWFITLIGSIMTMIHAATSKKRGSMFYLNSATVLIVYGVFYFQNRLLHTMCVNSL